MHRLYTPCLTALIVTGCLLVGCSMRSSSPPALSPKSASLLGLDRHRGDVVYVDFWASWCAPCVKSFPWMHDMQERYRKDGLAIIAVNVDVDRAAVDEFLAKHSPNFELIYDPKGDLASEFDLGGLPSSFLIGRDGVIRKSHVGFRDRDASRFENEIQSLLAEPAPGEGP